MRQYWQSMNTEEKAAFVRAQAENGLSARQIADKIQGASRNAIIGIAHRNKINLGGQIKKQRTTRSSAAPKRPTAKVVQIASRKLIAVPPQTKNEPAEVIQLPVKPVRRGPVNIFGLDMHTCRGPLNDDYNGLHPDDMMFCGEVTQPESSWCRKCQMKYTTGRSQVKRIVDDKGEPTVPANRKRRPFRRWER